MSRQWVKDIPENTIDLQGGLLVSPYHPSYKFCSYCGSKLQWGKDTHQYSHITGKPVFSWIYGCPKYGGSTVHDYWWENISSYIKRITQEDV